VQGAATSRRRVLIILQSRQLPSSVVMALQYESCFRDAGFDARFVALDEPEESAAIDRVANTAWRLYMRRLNGVLKERIRRRWIDRIIESAADFDVVYVVKIPSLSLHRRIASLGRPRVLTLFSDALWLPTARAAGWEDVDAILAASHGVLCINDYTAAYARRFNERVFILNDSPQTEEFDRVRGLVSRDAGSVRLGWIGAPQTVSTFFKIFEPLELLFAERPELHLRLLGTGHPPFLNLPRFEQVRWSWLADYDQRTMIREVLAMDIGLFPLYRGDDALARGANKAAIYMSGGVPVVARRYGEATELIEDGVNGMLADTDDEWREKIAWLADHPAERLAMGQRGLETVRQRFSKAATFAQLRHAIEHV
jgi:glycosyltransferase involved in cell wall biosynthesis